MVQTLVTGATGTLGTALRARLLNAGHTVRAASRSPPAETDGEVEWVALDLVADDEIASVLADVDVVIHAATAPQGDTQAVDVDGTDRLLEAATNAAVDHFVYPSIVGIDDIPFSYYQQKRATEALVEDSPVPTTIVRATQFHAFVADLLDSLSILPVWPLPTTMQVQPVDASEVAETIVDQATLPASGRSDPIGGPEVLSVGELARAYRAARGMRRPILRIPFPGGTTAAFRDGRATCPDHAVGTVTWEQWLAERNGREGNGMNGVGKREA
jgi:uncharacterized protein YbjT (DUF2867 family)